MFISMQDYFWSSSWIVSVFSTLEVFPTYKVPTTVLKIGVEIGEKFSRCLLSTQKFLYKTAWSTVLVFFKTEQKYLNW